MQTASFLGRGPFFAGQAYNVDFPSSEAGTCPVKGTLTVLWLRVSVNVVLVSSPPRLSAGYLFRADVIRLDSQSSFQLKAADRVVLQIAVIPPCHSISNHQQLPFAIFSIDHLTSLDSHHQHAF